MANSFNSIEDFLVDEFFKSWVLNPTLELDAFWTAWMDANPDQHVTLLRAKEILRSVRFNEFVADSDSRERILNQIKIETKDWNRSKKTILLEYWFKAAAVVFFALSLGILTYFLSSTSDQEQLAGVEMMVKENPLGVRSHHTLPDGSVVYLNAGSRIEYPILFQKDIREVELHGEAYFDVISDATRPFKVNTGTLEVTVLGTKFNVISESDHQSVALLEGSVRVSDVSSVNQRLLIPGQQAVYHINSKQFTIDTFDQSSVFGWIKGKLVFRDASFEKVMDRLHTWYGVQVVVFNRPNATDWSYTGSFNNESLENVLLNLSTVRDFEYKMANDTLRVTF